MADERKESRCQKRDRNYIKTKKRFCKKIAAESKINAISPELNNPRNL